MFESTRFNGMLCLFPLQFKNNEIFEDYIEIVLEALKEWVKGKPLLPDGL